MLANALDVSSQRAARATSDHLLQREKVRARITMGIRTREQPQREGWNTEVLNRREIHKQKYQAEVKSRITYKEKDKNFDREFYKLYLM